MIVICYVLIVSDALFRYVLPADLCPILIALAGCFSSRQAISCLFVSICHIEKAKNPVMKMRIGLTDPLKRPSFFCFVLIFLLFCVSLYVFPKPIYIGRGVFKKACIALL